MRRRELLVTIQASGLLGAPTSGPAPPAGSEPAKVAVGVPLAQPPSAAPAPGTPLKQDLLF